MRFLNLRCGTYLSFIKCWINVIVTNKKFMNTTYLLTSYWWKFVDAKYFVEKHLKSVHTRTSKVSYTTLYFLKNERKFSFNVTLRKQKLSMACALEYKLAKVSLSLNPNQKNIEKRTCSFLVNGSKDKRVKCFGNNYYEFILKFRVQRYHESEPGISPFFSSNWWRDGSLSQDDRKPWKFEKPFKVFFPQKIRCKFVLIFCGKKVPNQRY